MGDDHAVYMSPSIEYYAHPRYGSIEYNPETKHWVQVVLQCRVNPARVSQKQPETMRCAEFGLTVDPNLPNSVMTWLFEPNETDEATGHRYLTDAIVCTGIMIRYSKQHPLDMPHWWSKNKQYAKAWGLTMQKVDFSLPRSPPWFFNNWTEVSSGELFHFREVSGERGVETDAARRLDMSGAYISPLPFAKGHMRFCWYLHCSHGLFVIKRYNEETLRFIKDNLGETEQDAFWRDARTLLKARKLADEWNSQAVPKLEAHGARHFRVEFVEPLIARLDGTDYIAEKFVDGKFVKWNNNSGDVNASPEAFVESIGPKLSRAFSHFTYCQTNGQNMVVDLQGFHVGKRRVVFTDPQIHTRSYDGSSGSRRMAEQFSVGNLGRTGMAMFFLSHKCEECCQILGYENPADRHKREASSPSP